MYFTKKSFIKQESTSKQICALMCHNPLLQQCLKITYGITYKTTSKCVKIDIVFNCWCDKNIHNKNKKNRLF